MKIYAIIVTYNGIEWIENCLSSINNSSIAVEILLIDNKSSDSTIELVKLKFPKVIVFEPELNLGFGKANNIGLKYALEHDADYVFLLNQDAWVQPDTIESLTNIHLKNPNYGILSPIHLNGKGSALDLRFSNPCNSKDCPGLLSDIYLNRTKEIYSISFVNAALWLIPIDVLKKVGIFDPIFPHYGEDLDYVNRITAFKYDIGICPSLIGFHDREDRAPSEKRDSAMRYLGYLCVLKNINSTFGRSFLEFLFLWLRNLMRFLIKLKITLFTKEIFHGFKLFVSFPSIFRNRKICKKESAFLDITRR